MSVQSEQIVIFLIVTILIALFAWIYARDRQPRTGLWMLGWSAIYMHFTVALLFSFALLPIRWAVFLKISSLAMAGISFPRVVFEYASHCQLQPPCDSLVTGGRTGASDWTAVRRGEAGSYCA